MHEEMQTDWQKPDFEWAAPAKLNLFLHITGRRDDGYHLLQSLFQFIDFGDSLQFERTNDGKIQLSPSIEGVANEDNIIVKAALALQKRSNTPFGAKINLKKQIPMGGGLGGGSSDAATTLLALNKHWDLDYDKTQLMAIGLSLGADVPVFIFGRTAWAEGVGEQLSEVTDESILEKNWYLVVFPKINVKTSDIFASSELTRDKDPIRIRDFLNGPTENVFESVVTEQYPEIQEAINWLNQFAPTRLTGTGACLFASFGSEQQAKKIAALAPDKWQTIVAKGLSNTQIESFYWGVAKR